VIQNITSKLTFRVAAAALMLFGGNLLAQKHVDLGEIHGNFEIDAQTYKADSLIGAPEFPEKIGNNSFMNLLYTRGKFESGVRFESYYPTLQGFTRERGAGIPYRYARYRNEKFDVTAGTFLRAIRERHGAACLRSLGIGIRQFARWCEGQKRTRKRRLSHRLGWSGSATPTATRSKI
jgi:hypothetical protein